MSDYDSPWKEALDRYFEPFLAFFFPDAHRGIDWSRGYEMLDKELQQVVRDAEVGPRLADKLVKVWRHGGEETWVLIHVEVQSQEEGDFARRMYVYNYRLFDRYNRTVVSLAVLGDERPGWRPTRFGYGLWGCTVGIEFQVVKLLDYAANEPALEADPNPFATVVLAHLKTQETRQDPEARRGWKIRLVRSLYDRGMSREDILQLFHFIDWMMDLPAALEEGFWQEMNRFEAEGRMPYISSVERIGMRKGREEGRVEGLREGLLAGIELGLKLRFGVEGLQLMPDIRQVSSVEVLQAVHQAIEGAASPDDLRRIVSQGPGDPPASGQP